MAKKKVSKVGSLGKSKGKVKKKDKMETQLAWVLLVMGLVFASFLGVYLYVQSLNSFEYAGIEWNKIKFGELDLYHGRFPIVYLGKLHANYNVFFNTDPRENEVPLEIEQFGFNKKVILSYSPDAWDCPGAKKSFGDLENFLVAFPFIENVSGAYTKKTFADSLNEDFADCSFARDDTTVFVFQKSEEASIERSKKYPECYVVNVGECKNVLATERIVLGVIEQLNFTKVE